MLVFSSGEGLGQILPPYLFYARAGGGGGGGGGGWGGGWGLLDAGRRYGGQVSISRAVHHHNMRMATSAWAAGRRTISMIFRECRAPGGSTRSARIARAGSPRGDTEVTSGCLGTQAARRSVGGGSCARSIRDLRKANGRPIRRASAECGPACDDRHRDFLAHPMAADRADERDDVGPRAVTGQKVVMRRCWGQDCSQATRDGDRVLIRMNLRVKETTKNPALGYCRSAVMVMEQGYASSRTRPRWAWGGGRGGPARRPAWWRAPPPPPPRPPRGPFPSIRGTSTPSAWWLPRRLHLVVSMTW